MPNSRKSNGDPLSCLTEGHGVLELVFAAISS